MLLLTKKINIELPNENKVHSFLKSIPDKLWEGWTITRKGHTSHLNFNVDKPTKAKITAIIQKRITIVASSQPRFSK